MTLPQDDANFAVRWQRIKTLFTQSLNVDTMRRRDGTGRTLWQRRYWEHTIRDAADFARHVDYIHINPVKHGYVRSPANWPYSSLHRYIRQGVLPPDWATDCDGEDSAFGEPDAPGMAS